MKNPNDKSHTIRFSPETYELLRAMSAADKRSINNEVVIAVEERIARYIAEHGPLLPADK